MTRSARRRHQYAVDLPGYIAFEATDNLSSALALRGASCDVLLRATISSHPSQTDHVQCSVGVPVAAAVEAVPNDLAGGSLDRRDTAEAGEGGLTPQPMGIVSGHDQQRRGVVGADARQGNQLWGGFQNQPIELHAQLCDLFGEDLVATGHRTKREPGRLPYVVGGVFEAEAGGHGDELLRREPAQTVAEFLRCC